MLLRAKDKGKILSTARKRNDTLYREEQKYELQ